MIHVEVRDQQQIHLGWIDLVKKGQGVKSCAAWMDATVEHDSAALELDDNGRAADLTSAAERHDLHDVISQLHLLRPRRRRHSVSRKGAIGHSASEPATLHSPHPRTRD
eukprot:scaffold271793_cov30-Tisochrysis_lutea.AAC.1